MPSIAMLLTAWLIFAGKTAMNSAISPQAAARLTVGMSNPIPPREFCGNTAIPANSLQNLKKAANVDQFQRVWKLGRYNLYKWLREGKVQYTDSHHRYGEYDSGDFLVLVHLFSNKVQTTGNLHRTCFLKSTVGCLCLYSVWQYCNKIIYSLNRSNT